MAVTVYEMMMKLGLENTASAGLAAVASQLTKISEVVSLIGNGVGGWGLAFAAVGGVLAGGAIIKGLEDIAKHGGVVNHQIELMKQAGMGAVEIQEAMAQASTTSGNVMTTTLSENLQHIRELRYAFGETTEAVKHLDEISKANAILNAVKGGGHDQVWDLVKALENKGLTFKPEEFSSYIDTMTKVVQATGGKVTPSAFMNTFKYGRTATLGWDEEFVGGALPRLIQSMSSSGSGGGGGSGGPGNALMSTFAEIVQGKISKDAAFELQKMELVGNVKHKKGEDTADIEGFQGQDLFMRNPYEWVQQVLMPKLAAKGITDQNKIIQEIGIMFPNRTASQVLSEMGLQGRFHEGEQSPFEKDIRLQKGAMGNIPGYEELSKHDYPTIIKEFHQQWKNLMETIGGPMMAPGGPVIKAMSAVVSVMGSMGKMAAEHPEATQIIISALAGVAALFVVLGGAALLAAAAALIPGGIVALAIGGIATAVGTLAYLEWDRIKTGFETVKNAIAGFISWIEDTVHAVQHFFDLSRFLAKKTSFEGDGPSQDRPMMPINFSPGEKKQVLQPVQMTLNLDGRTLGQAMSDVMEDLYNHPTGSATPNGWDSYRSVDANVTGA